MLLVLDSGEYLLSHLLEKMGSIPPFGPSTSPIPHPFLLTPTVQMFQGQENSH